MVGAQNVVPKPELGFEFKEEIAPFCQSCSMITINSPKNYIDRPASHAIFSVFLNGNLLSKSISPFKDDSKVAEFFGVVSNEKGVSYEINIMYGKGRCMGYKFTYSGASNAS